MNVINTEIEGVKIIEPRIFGDARGYFFESFNSKDFAEQTGIQVNFVQDNESKSRYGVVRGLHFQKPPYAQSKLVRVVSGRVLDVAVDIRKGSPQYAQWVGVRLSAENKKQLFLPRGFAHGFLTLTDDVEVQYKADNYYSPEHDGGVRWDDPAIGVEWPMKPLLLSDKDKSAPTLAERAASGLNFAYREAEA